MDNPSSELQQNPPAKDVRAQQPSTLDHHEPSPTESPPLSPAASFASAAAIPGQFGRYQIIRRLGQGGMGVVYLARDTQLDRQVALKVPNFSGTADAAVLERFYREARAAAMLNHPNICPIYDVGEWQGTHYLTMAYIEGQSLAEQMEQLQTQSPRRIAALVERLALALAEAHRHGIIHRDLKPSNVMINVRGEPVVMDFGLARRLNTEDSRLTQSGAILGTPAYMSPEQVLGETDRIGPATDIYSLGVILYELLTGRLPFPGTSGTVLAQILNQEPVPPSKIRPGLERHLEEICQQAMAKDIGRRFAGMDAFAAALAAFGNPAASTPPPTATVASNPVLPSEPSVLNDVLSSLRDWGWEVGLEKLRSRRQELSDIKRRAALDKYLSWLVNEEVGTAGRRYPPAEQAPPELAGWLFYARAQEDRKDRDFASAHELLDRAETVCPKEDTTLQANIAHLRGVMHFHAGQADRALPMLHQALELFGRRHIGTGRVLDSLGMVYAARDHFHAAREFFEQAIVCKEALGDEAGIALSHGQLGRLYLDWGHLDQAEEHFQVDLEIAQKNLHDANAVQMYNHLGQLALRRGYREAAAGRKATARKQWATAAGWLDAAIRRSQERRWLFREAFARKDRALVYLADDNVPAAEAEVARADELFRSKAFTEGIAHVNRVWGLVHRARERYDESTRALRQALGYFDGAHERAETARTQLEIARTLRAAEHPRPLVTQEFVQALERAEACRRVRLVREIEEELEAVDPEAILRHVYRRVRGRRVTEDTTSLVSGISEAATVLCFDVEGAAACSREGDPEVVLLTLNQVLADLEAVLDRYRGQVSGYVGGGFMALFREPRHAERAVHAALDLMAALEEFNRPRTILNLVRFQGRIGVATGSIFLGNVGTYHKMDYTALGSPVRLAFHLQDEADQGFPCISEETYQLVAEQFTFRNGKPRLVTLHGACDMEVWDVTGKK